MIVRHGPLSADFKLTQILKGYLYTGMSLYKLEKNTGKSNEEIFKDRFFFSLKSRKLKYRKDPLRHLKFLLSTKTFIKRNDGDNPYSYFHETHELLKERLIYLGMRYAQFFK